MKELLVVKWWLYAHFAMNVICEKFKMKLSALGPPLLISFPDSLWTHFISKTQDSTWKSTYVSFYGIYH